MKSTKEVMARLLDEVQALDRRGRLPGVDMQAVAREIGARPGAVSLWLVADARVLMVVLSYLCEVVRWVVMSGELDVAEAVGALAVVRLVRGITGGLGSDLRKQGLVAAGELMEKEAESVAQAVADAEAGGEAGRG
jgi:hypothetical protein